MQTGKKKIELSLFIDDMIVYAEIQENHHHQQQKTPGTMLQL